MPTPTRAADAHSARSAPEPLPYTAIGAFRLVKSLGIGSTGEVFLAGRLESFAQRVAIKVLSTGPAREAAILTALDHPHIVKLIDRGTLPDGPAYLVMEYVEGEPLDRHCATHAPGAAARLGLLVKVLDALSYAHRHLVIHADLKPANILVTAAGEPKLLDFGVAQWLDRPGPGGLTPAFASPEQRSGARLTAASDVYSLGRVAQALLPGPQDADLDAVLSTATRADPDQRYVSVDAFKADLQSHLEGRAVTVRRTGPWGGAVRWVRHHRITATTVLLLALTLAAAIAGVVRNATLAARQRTLAEIQLRQLVTLTGTLEGELYASVEPLPQSAAARHILLQGASDTLAALAGREHGDSLLLLELARQYATLARLQRHEAVAPEAAGATPAGVTAAGRTALADIDEGVRLLRRIGRRDPRYAEAQRDLTAMLGWRAANAAP